MESTVAVVAAVEILSDINQNSLLREQEIEVERGVILREMQVMMMMVMMMMKMVMMMMMMMMMKTVNE